MTREALRDGAITYETLSDALLKTRGDLFLTSQYLGCTAREVDKYIRADDNLRAFVQAIATVKSEDDYERLSAEQFERELQRLMTRHRVEAEHIIADMARMEFETAAMAEVKLKAAVAMRGKESNHTVADQGQANALAELNRLYVEAAPRVRSVRAQLLVEYEPGPSQ